MGLDKVVANVREAFSGDKDRWKEFDVEVEGYLSTMEVEKFLETLNTPITFGPLGFQDEPSQDMVIGNWLVGSVADVKDPEARTKSLARAEEIRKEVAVKVQAAPEKNPERKEYVQHLLYPEDYQ